VPTYDLACTPCGHEFEAFRQGFLREEDRVCPECGAAGATQRFTGFVTARPSRGEAAAAPTVTGFGGGACCGGSCGCG
jgi:putative FmdB family regulatory protein